MAHETELKFRIPPARLAALRRAVATRSVTRLSLAASYVDTPGEHLARARCALRLRLEDTQWVQTLKAEGDGPLQRLEHEVPLPDPSDARPALDVSRHAGTEAGARLQALLAAAGPGQPLVERYGTRVQRTRRLLRSGAAVIELALDEGAVQAAGRSQALCEIEFELVQGPPQALLALAARWMRRHGLLLDTRSKSELGHTLAAGLPGSPPVVARRVRRGSDGRSALAQALRPALANASQLSAGSAQLGHLRQLRRALRRLRRGLRRVDGAPVGGPGGATRGTPVPALAPALAALRTLDGVLAAIGQPLADSSDGEPLPDAASRAVADLLARPAVQRLWLDLIALGLPAA